jgi:hypothetical protein
MISFVPDATTGQALPSGVQSQARFRRAETWAGNATRLRFSNADRHALCFDPVAQSTVCVVTSNSYRNVKKICYASQTGHSNSWDIFVLNPKDRVFTCLMCASAKTWKPLAGEMSSLRKRGSLRFMKITSWYRRVRKFKLFKSAILGECVRSAFYIPPACMKDSTATQSSEVSGNDISISPHKR